MKLYFSVLCISILFSDSESLSTRKLTFEDDRCYGPFYPTSRESFEVTHTTDQLSFLCRDFSFSGWDDGASLEREVCVKVKEFILDCSQTLEYRAGGNRNTPVRTYSCSDSAENIPVFCTFELLYIRIKTERKIESSKVVYTVYAGREDTSNKKSSPVSAIVGVALSIGFIVFIVCIVMCIRRRKLNEMQNRGAMVAYRQNQQPSVNIHHHYHQGHTKEIRERIQIRVSFKDNLPFLKDTVCHHRHLLSSRFTLSIHPGNR
ncbi:uncharacterized protein LOC130051668 isoform X2 [Ostrea edulis]|uniref:uncharacterized protein LOC130051668 isoform X2 n=1 Tax=Ostrea edulis TaxID=37623 RepID=UPI0024AF4B20|nr:uncharacterized protein LOC130051668 isoform X2 [Ostrea edulis]